MVTILREYAVDFWAVGALPLGVGLDLALGRFDGKPGPTRPIERLIDLAQKGLRGQVARRGGRPKDEFLAGLLLTLIVVGLVGGLAFLASELLDPLAGPANLIGRALLIAWGLSIGRFGSEELRAAEAPDLATARREAVHFIGLDSTRLDQSSIRRACVRSVGERANRLVIAPLFWLAIAGPAGLWSYQAIATLGRRIVDGGPRLRDFWLVASRLVDLANLLPARLTWLLIALSAALMGEDGGSALRSGLVQGRRQPNRPGVWGMATLTAALGLQPGGLSFEEPVESGTVRLAVRITQVAGLHAAALAVAFRIVFVGD